MQRPVFRPLHATWTALVVLAAALLGPSGASAATTFEIVNSAIVIIGDDGPSRIVATGGNGEGEFEDQLPGGVVVAGAGCLQLSASAVDCGKADAGGRITAKLGGGNDEYRFVGDPIQVVDGGPGNDAIETGTNKDELTGGPGDDTLTGGPADDVLDGGDGADTLFGGEGSDTVTGGAGRDAIRGDVGGGTSGSANNNDKIFARDGEVDTIDCGGGTDIAQVDAIDVFTGCSNPQDGSGRPVTSSGKGGNGAAGTGGTTKPATPGAMSVLASLAKRQTTKALAKGKKLRVAVTASPTCTGTVAIELSKGEAKRTKIGTTPLPLGKSAATAFKPGTMTTVTIGVDRKYRAKVGRQQRLKATVVVFCSDAAGTWYTRKIPVTFKR